MDLLVEFFRHNTMMNKRLLETCGSLSADELSFALPGAYGEVGATLVHIANSQEIYAARLLEEERPMMLDEDPFPGFDVLAVRFANGNSRLEAAAKQGVGDLEVIVTGDDPPGRWSMPLSLYFLQAINHCTEHRSQVATMLTHLGIEPPEMDGWAYFFGSGNMTDV